MKKIKKLAITLFAGTACAMVLSATAIAKEVDTTIATNPAATIAMIGTMNLAQLPDQVAANMRAGAFLTLDSPFPTNGTPRQKLRYAACMAQLRLGVYTPMCNIY